MGNKIKKFKGNSPIRGVAFLILSVCFSYITLTSPAIAKGEPNMNISSPEFNHNQSIPSKFTCEGKNINPALIIDVLPKDAQSLALIVDDPDAPMGTWVHWVVFDIPLINKIDENSIPGKQGITSSGKKDFHGPCPPSGTHRYFFKIYALDTKLNLKEGISKKELEAAMQGHILDKAELIGLYKKIR
ncbi:MAG: YbhB/YbcL family Raf kinase inhibitor-like protein [Candidatus Omnitrophota bacterium]